jgi:predicted nucleic acid-binding protein
MRTAKIYLETTLFNFYFDEERDAHIDTLRLFHEIAKNKFEAFTSTYVTEELEQAPQKKRDKMLALIAEYRIVVLAPNDESVKLANIYVNEGIIPVKYRTDGLHIAIASVNDLDMIVSMNFQHIVKRKTKLATASINALNGYRQIEIVSPMEVVENEDIESY